MSDAHAYSSDVAFTPSVKALQTRKGSRARAEERGAWETRITPDLAEFIAAQTSVFLATVSDEGQPYIQHRGGPAGFLRILDDKTIGFVDFAGNRQYITQGNLADNPKAHLFLIDYARRRRVKIWGAARVVEGDAALTAPGTRTAPSTSHNGSRRLMLRRCWPSAIVASRRSKPSSGGCVRRYER